ncbi:MAG: DUF2167 domain-containing protein [Allosphingosinicella sp.]
MPASAVAAEPPAQVKAELDAAWAAAEKTAVMGPTEIKLLDQATLKIPAGEAFIPSAEANRIMAALGNSTGAPRQGLVVGRGKDDSWLVDVVWIQEGYVRDGDAKEWKADELLQSLKDGTEEDNSGRLARGLPALDVVGWVEPPAYDPRTHRLVWSLSLQERGMPEGQPQTINYNTYALGRDGYFSLDLIAGSDTIAADKSVARDLLASLNYVPGKRYEEFNGSTDKVAAYGLGALIGVVAAKKLGLLAVIGVFLLKMWKIGLLLLAGVGAAIRRFFGGRGNEAPEAEYYAAEPETPVAEPDTHAAEPESHADEPGSEPALQAGEPGP